MQFGKLDPAALEKANLVLPPDHAATARVLSKSKNGQPTAFHIGCTSWVHPSWVGRFYPKGTPSSRFLNEYAKQFNTIEFNSTWYKLPSLEQVATWKQKAGNNFRFCPKFPDTITHVKQLKNTEPELSAFIQMCEAFGESLGPVFLMPHPQMGAAGIDIILHFIGLLPSEIEVFTEFRNPQLLIGRSAAKVFDEMEKMQYGAVITDVAGRRDCAHMRLTTPKAFIRFVGNGLHATDYTRIDEWVQRLKTWMQQGLQECYFFVHQPEEIYSPELCRYLIEQLNQHCGTQLKAPRLMEEQDLRLF